MLSRYGGGIVSCTKDSEKDVDYSVLYGTWNDVENGEASSDFLSMGTYHSWTFREDKTATQKLEVTMNGLLFRSERLDYEYSYDGDVITFVNTETEDILVYDVEIEGNHMRLGNEDNGYFELIKE